MDLKLTLEKFKDTIKFVDKEYECLYCRDSGSIPIGFIVTDSSTTSTCKLKEMTVRCHFCERGKTAVDERCKCKKLITVEPYDVRPSCKYCGGPVKKRIPFLNEMFPNKSDQEQVMMLGNPRFFIRCLDDEDFYNRVKEKMDFRMAKTGLIKNGVSKVWYQRTNK